MDAQPTWQERVVDLRKLAGRPIRLTDRGLDRRYHWPAERYTAVLTRWARRCARRLGVVCGEVRVTTTTDVATGLPVLYWSTWTAPLDAGVTERDIDLVRERGRSVVVTRSLDPANAILRVE